MNVIIGPAKRGKSRTTPNAESSLAGRIDAPPTTARPPPQQRYLPPAGQGPLMLGWLRKPADDVAYLGGIGASAVRADRRPAVLGDVRRERRFSLSHAGSVGRCQVGSGYRVGLQVGGRGFESRTLHLQKNLFAGLSAARFPPPATAVRARCERTAESCRAQSSDRVRGVCRP
jgi:hypothetical protein